MGEGLLETSCCNASTSWLDRILLDNYFELLHLETVDGGHLILHGLPAADPGYIAYAVVQDFRHPEKKLGCNAGQASQES